MNNAPYSNLGISKGRLLELTRMLSEEAFTVNPDQAEAVVMECLDGATVFVWSRLTMEQVLDLRQGFHTFASKI